MKTSYIDVDGYWGVVIVYDYDAYDEYDLAQIMETFDLPQVRIKEALDVLSNPNTGMTLTRNDVRMSIVFVSNATNEEEWWDSLCHELHHVVTHIIDYYDEPYDKEGAAYLKGFLMRQAVREFGEPCN